MKKGFSAFRLPVVLIAAFVLTLPSLSAQDNSEKRFVVVFHQQNSLPNGVEKRVADAGGTVVATLEEAGTVVATSSSPTFIADMGRDPSVSDVGEDLIIQMIPSEDRMNVQSAYDLESYGDGPTEAPGTDAQTGSEPFYRFQWDKKRMRASNQGSYAVQQGRPDVVVAILDTGADILPVPHQDIAPNLDFARSRSFINTPTVQGDPNPLRWDDKNGHGSWCLSAVGAPINARGISGVAPRVKLVALKVLGDNGSGSYVAVSQALIYAGLNKFDVASMSLGGYLRHANQGSNALIKMLHRAVNFARSNGVTPLGALGNDGYDLSDGSFFRDFIEVPGEISGVIGVSATGYFNLKASYSNYGVGKTDVSAPGGDFGVQATSQTNPVGGGSVVGAWAQERFGPNAYAFASGTSMATPNAAGVAALIISQYGDFTPDNGQKTHMSPQAVESILQQTANNQPCPDPRTVIFLTVFPIRTRTGILPTGTQLFGPQTCQGDAGYNNFFGKGIVDAFKAVTSK